MLSRKTSRFKWLGKPANLLRAGEKRKRLTHLAVAQEECAHSMR